VVLLDEVYINDILASVALEIGFSATDKLSLARLTRFATTLTT